MVRSLVASGNMVAAASSMPLQETGYERQLACQIWSLHGRLIARSSKAPEAQLAEEAEGFANKDVGGETWRVYTIVDPEKGVRVAVGDRVGLRDRLVRDLVAGLMAPALLIVPLLGSLIWGSLGRGLKPLNAIASDIAARDGEDMRPIAAGGAPSEVHPLIAALNALFGKVESARRHEREVTAFAAHELRTPLAGLKTQAQVALAAGDAATREAALRQILVSVDRTARLVRQLLALAQLEAAPSAQGDGKVEAGALLRDVAHAAPRPDNIAVEIDPALDGLVLRGDREILHLVLRNLHENAVEHMPEGGCITWKHLPDRTGLMVEDQGPGIPEDELPLVTQRFYRGRHKSPSGTGLGLTIAEAAAARVRARLTLANRTDRKGVRASVEWLPCL